MKIPKNLKYENSLWSSGLKIIAGVDEVGRGSLAGPLVAAAVVWPIDILDWIGEKSHPHYEFLTKIKDSKTKKYLLVKRGKTEIEEAQQVAKYFNSDILILR